MKISIAKSLKDSPLNKKAENDHIKSEEVDIEDNDNHSLNVDDSIEDNDDPDYEDDNVNEDDGGDEDYTETSSPSKKSSADQDSPRKELLKRREQRKYANSIGFHDKYEQEDKAILIENLKQLGLTALSKNVFKNAKLKKIFKTVMSCPTLRLPCPVELMSHPQLVYWLQKEILRDIIEQGKVPRLRIFWGEESCHPLCWPDEVGIIIITRLVATSWCFLNTECAFYLLIFNGFHLMSPCERSTSFTSTNVKLRLRFDAHLMFT